MRVTQIVASILCFLALLISSCFLSSSSLDIEAQIIYNMGGPQPVARQTFYLLDADIFNLRADDPKIKAKHDSLKSDNEKLGFTMAGMLLLSLREAAEKKQLVEGKEKGMLGTLEMAKEYFEPHLVQTVQTDFKGHARFENLKPGQYWVAGMTETRSAFALWNLKVDVKRGENKLLLDQHNAAYSK